LLLPQNQNGSGWETGAYVYLKHCNACDMSRLRLPIFGHKLIVFYHTWTAPSELK
jgi:hypothetical protein